MFQIYHLHNLHNHLSQAPSLGICQLSEFFELLLDCFHLGSDGWKLKQKILMTSNLSLRSLVVGGGILQGFLEARSTLDAKILCSIPPPTGNNRKQPHLGVAILNALLGFQARIHRRRNLFVFASGDAEMQLFHQKKQRKKMQFQQKLCTLKMTFQVLGPKVNHMLPTNFLAFICLPL